ncbi:hypothetical protein DCAR_0205355 [Daucus carota subsp. sativus]|uniref:Receptor-like serine/threonine-protein kinase n=1 Tax=Daucus carota subsp. sativus TaxID=79200 RepID=A0AAF0WBQ8_DAUCS|nr:hypothetical protein DCAR_0205355 [Daucus carota subsp. sativus]
MAQTLIILFCSSLTISLLAISSASLDTLTPNQTIADGAKTTLISAAGAFEMGFFSPGSSSTRYLGIWYNNIANGTVAWVANRNTPLSDTSGVLRFDHNGGLILTDGGSNVVWSAKSSKASADLVVQLLDTGNLVIRPVNDSYPDNYLWQSFDYPGDCILPGMKFGLDLTNGVNRQLTSWKSLDDPSTGVYRSGVNGKGYPEIFLWNGSDTMFRLGPWNGIPFGGRSSLLQNAIFTYNFVLDEAGAYYMFQLLNASTAMRLMLNSEGDLQFLTWHDPKKGWEITVNLPTDKCDDFSVCGANGNCNMTKSKLGQEMCDCFEGFSPSNLENNEIKGLFSGCVRKRMLTCGNQDVFSRYPGLKLPDTQNSWIDPRLNLDECKAKCLNNCSCTAYANMDIKEGGSGCVLWFGDLFDTREFLASSQVLYLRTAGEGSGIISRSKGKAPVAIIVIVVLVVVTVVLSLFLLVVYKKKKLRRKADQSQREDFELPLFEFARIAKATNNFSNNNKLGEGGFGPVYMGILEEGQEIAVKRLSKTSKQGLDEFKNEVLCIAKLQHRNLVRLLGCSIEEGEMLLIYEFMPNKSLDFFIFDKVQSKLLDWPKRYNIINGVAKGLLYLHRDSRLRIIHRDLKAGNILLDHDMNPKVSDFGTAKSFWGSQSEASTTRVVGTFGYMSPEYALDGIFSFKSDVYSFGVLVLEIISGKRMKGFYQPDPNLNLLGQAWRLYNEQKFLELVDKAILQSCNYFEVCRAIQIALLCVQPYPEDRPEMELVNLMLSSAIEMPRPNQPGFFTAKKLQDSNSSSSLILDNSDVFYSSDI